MAFDDIIGKSAKPRIIKHVNLRPKAITVSEARDTIKKAFDDDRSFYNGYIANVAMLIHDRYGVDILQANDMAHDILNLIFD